MGKRAVPEDGLGELPFAHHISFSSYHFFFFGSDIN